MQIAKDTGSVTIAEISISPNLTRSALKVSQDFSAWQSYVGDAISYFSYKRRVIENESQRILVAVFFHVEQLTEVELFYLLPNEPESSGWENWSEAQEVERKALHETQLQATLGESPYEFEWGKVLSVYDSRSGASHLIIRYNIS